MYHVLCDIKRQFTFRTFSFLFLHEPQLTGCYGLEGILGFDFRRGLEIFLFTAASRTALGPTQSPIQCVKGALFLGVKKPGREVGHSPSSSAEVKEWVEL